VVAVVLSGAPLSATTLSRGKWKVDSLESVNDWAMPQSSSLTDEKEPRSISRGTGPEGRSGGEGLGEIEGVDDEESTAAVVVGRVAR
jgi:hypothetical protein